MLKLYRYLGFIAYYLVKLVEANFIIAWDIITPKLKIQPDFISIDLDLEKDHAILLFSNLVSMTPGTLSADINENKSKMLVHILYAQQKEQIMDELLHVQQKIKLMTN